MEGKGRGVITVELNQTKNRHCKCQPEVDVNASDTRLGGAGAGI